MFLNLEWYTDEKDEREMKKKEQEAQFQLLTVLIDRLSQT